MQTIDQVIDILEGSRLFSLAVNGERFLLECLNDKIGDNSSVVGVHSRSESVENTGDTDVNFTLIFIRVHHRLSYTFAFVVTRARTNRIDVSPITFGLRVNLRVSINFAGGSKQNSGFDAFCKSQHVQSSHSACLNGLDRVELVMGRGGGARKVIDFVDFYRKWFRDIVDFETKVRVMHPMSDIFLLSREKVINDSYLVALHHELVDQMRTYEPGPASHQDFLSSVITENSSLHNTG
mmetsp:Transcript_17404/g.40008  ORF Transcript_17404/g.40008 Transcript_17404/m.40008 type:complete len:237 (-) Transcript_17404:501-1211(-)